MQKSSYMMQAHVRTSGIGRSYNWRGYLLACLSAAAAAAAVV